MHKKIDDFCRERTLLEKNDRIVLGVSGGADSVYLLTYLLERQKELSLSLFVVHVHHGLRGERADEDAQFVEELCKSTHIPYKIVSVNVKKEAKIFGLGEEEAGRKLRYEAFLTIAKQKNYNKIATAHHKNDNAETILFRAFRGTGLDGLCGILPKTPFPLDTSYQLIRPLLCLSREEILEEMMTKNLSFVTDETNQASKYRRNCIRNEILSVAKDKINTKAIDNLCHLSEQCVEIFDYLERQTDRLLEKLVTRSDKGIELTITGEEEDLLLERVLRRCLFFLAGQEKDIGRVHILALMELREKQVGRKINLPYGIIAKRTYQGMLLQKSEPRTKKEATNQAALEEIVFDDEKLIEGISVLLPNHEGSLLLRRIPIEKLPKDFHNFLQNDYTKCFDYDTIKGTVSLRTARDDDYLILHPNGQKKKLKDYFKDEKISQEKRQKISLLMDQNCVLWVISKRTGEGARITDATKNVLLVEWKKEAKGYIYGRESQYFD